MANPADSLSIRNRGSGSRLRDGYEALMGLLHGDSSRVGYGSPKAPTRHRGLHGEAMRFCLATSPHWRNTMSSDFEIFNNGHTPYSLYSATDVEQWPGVSWLVEGIIQSRSSVLLYGESRIGKSFLALDLAIKLATGSDWFGYPVKRSRVVFFAAESPSGLRQRLRAYRLCHGQEIPDELLFMRAPVDLTRPEDLGRLIATVQPTADVLIIDTLNAASSEMDENNGKEMGKVLAGVRRIVSELGVSVILVHHCGWSDNDRPRGHSSLPASADTRLLVTRDTGHPAWRVKGQREGADTEFHRYALRVVELPAGEGTSCAVLPLSLAPAAKVFPGPTSKHQKVVFDVAQRLLKDSNALPLSADTLTDQATALIDTDPHHRRLRAAEAVKALVDKGFLQVNPEGLLALAG